MKKFTSFLFIFVFFLGLFIINAGSADAAALLNRGMVLGSRGSNVETLQQILINGGYLSGAIDGRYGPATARAVGDFQERNNIPRTEIVDMGTLRALGSVVGVVVQSPPQNRQANASSGASSELSASVLSAFSDATAPLPAGKYRFTQFLENGSRGNETTELQKYLNQAGYNAGAVDGVFGGDVKAAVIDFQIDHKLKSDGSVGMEVRSLLNR